MAKDFYKVLGVDRSASAADIKKAYRQLSKELHPDKNKGKTDTEQRFKEVNEAYEVLSDEKKKQQYDQFGSTSGPGGRGGPGAGFGGFSQGDMGGFADIFENFFGGQAGGGRARRDDRHGENIEVQITFALLDVVVPQQQTIGLERMVECVDCSGKGATKDSKIIKCDICDGTGQVSRTQQSFFGVIQQAFVCEECEGAGEKPENPCKNCRGDGRVRKRDEVTIDIPAGVHSGQSLRVRGQGNAGRRGGATGDLFVHIHVRPDARFQRDGDDIRNAISIPVIDAILGTTITEETVHGPVDLKIPEGLQPGQVLRVKGKGMPIVGSSRMGDHYVTIEVDVPKKLSKSERVLMEEWRGMQH